MQNPFPIDYPAQLSPVVGASTDRLHADAHNCEGNAPGSHACPPTDASLESTTHRPVILHLDPLTGSLHDPNEIMYALVEWLRFQLQQESGVEMSSAATLCTVDFVQVRHSHTEI